MALYYFDFTASGQTFRDQYGTQYPDLEAAWRDVRSALLDLARCDVRNTEYQITVREGQKTLRSSRLAFSEEIMDGGVPSLAP